MDGVERGHGIASAILKNKSTISNESLEALVICRNNHLIPYFINLHENPQTNMIYLRILDLVILNESITTQLNTLQKPTLQFNNDAMLSCYLNSNMKYAPSLPLLSPLPLFSPLQQPLFLPSSQTNMLSISNNQVSNYVQYHEIPNYTVSGNKKKNKPFSTIDLASTLTKQYIIFLQWFFVFVFVFVFFLIYSCQKKN
jgi:hypothetical protein